MTKGLFYKRCALFLLTMLLPLMLWMATQASISGDEFLHRNQAETVVDFFFSMGTDQKALDTPVTNLKHYGQSYDNLASLIARIFQIDDIFLLRHLMSALAGWLIIGLSALFAKKIGGWPAAFFVILLLAISPRFLGHSLNNLKDIPFALGYLAGLYFINNLIKQWPCFRQKTIWWLIAAIAFAISIRPPGMILLAYLGLAVVIMASVSLYKKEINISSLSVVLSTTLLIMLTGYFAGLLFWPYALIDPITHPFVSHRMMEAYPVTIRQLFMGEMVWSDRLPWFYLPWMMLISVPLTVWIGVILFLFLYRYTNNQKAVILLLFAILFPLLFIIVKQSNVYGGWRHILFIYPPLVILSGFGFFMLFNRLKNRWIQITAILFVTVSLIEPALFMVRNHPFYYLYFNPLVGGYRGAFANYEADYYFNTIDPAARWLNQHLKQTGERDVTIASNFETGWHFRHNKQVKSVLQVPWYSRDQHDWDYAVFSATYLHAHTLTPSLWPPQGTIHVVSVDDLPVSVVIKRTDKSDYLGWQALKAGSYANAIGYLKTALATNNKNEGAWLNLSRVFYQHEAYGKAIPSLDEALAIHPSFEPAMLEKARCYLKLGQTEEAMKQINELLTGNIKYQPAWLLRSELEATAGNQEAAIQTLRNALKINPSFAEVRNKLLELTKNE